MEKVLNQEEIDALIRRAQGGEQEPVRQQGEPLAEPWDVRRAGQIGREQLQAITLLHEGFARNLTHSLAAYLRVVFSAALVSAEHLTYQQFLQCIPETTYLASCRLDPLETAAALQLDLKVALPIVDLLLGGAGKSLAATRAVTEIEEQILDSVARIICRELGAAWQALTLEVRFEGRLEPAEAQRLMPPEEKMLSLSFEITMPDVRGGLNLVVPATVSNALQRKISADWAPRRLKDSADSRERLKRRLEQCGFEAELGAKDLRMGVGVLASLAVGDVLRFARPTVQPASLLIAGTELFQAMPVRCESKRAARVLCTVPQVAAKEKERTE